MRYLNWTFGLLPTLSTMRLYKSRIVERWRIAARAAFNRSLLTGEMTIRIRRNERATVRPAANTHRDVAEYSPLRMCVAR